MLIINPKMNKTNQERKEIKEPNAPHPHLKYCVRCCMPETSEGINFDELGICRACQSSEEKMHINWVERRKQLVTILEKYKNQSGDNYDCMVPISGGKDSCFQLHMIKKVFGLKPLAVTFSHNWFSEVGKYNLKNILEKLNIDHILFTPNRELINKLARKSIFKIGDACWHCHAGVGSFPLQIAVKYKIPLLVWGESIAEYSGRAKHSDEHLIKFDKDYFVKQSAKFYPEEFTDEEISTKDIFPFKFPSIEEVEEIGLVGIYLGNYIFWDEERQVEFLKKEYDWREMDKADGTYKHYKSAECKMHGVHDYAKFLKRGFGRTTDHACSDVRAGIITREEGFKLIKKYDHQIPKSLPEFLEMTKLSEEEFHKAMAYHKDIVMNKRKEVKSDKLDELQKS
jgi:N-acetyl sugar amidotransferase